MSTNNTTSFRLLPRPPVANWATKYDVIPFRIGTTTSGTKIDGKDVSPTHDKQAHVLSSETFTTTKEEWVNLVPGDQAARTLAIKVFKTSHRKGNYSQVITDTRLFVKTMNGLTDEWMFILPVTKEAARSFRKAFYNWTFLALQNEFDKLHGQVTNLESSVQLLTDENNDLKQMLATKDAEIARFQCRLAVAQRGATPYITTTTTVASIPAHHHVTSVPTNFVHDTISQSAQEVIYDNKENSLASTKTKYRKRSSFVWQL